MNATISQLKILINLALIDGEVAEREKKYIFNIGVANGLLPEDIMPLFDQEHEVFLPDNLSEDQRFNYIFSLVRLMKIDERLYQDEIKYCSKIASKLGYEQDIMFELMLNVKSTTMNDDEVNKLKEMARKYFTN